MSLFPVGVDRYPCRTGNGGAVYVFVLRVSNLTLSEYGIRSTPLQVRHTLKNLSNNNCKIERKLHVNIGEFVENQLYMYTCI